MHSGSRTWLYIKKAATVILGVNIILWALMYFPVADNTAFEKERTTSFLTLKTELEKSGVIIASVPEIADAVKARKKPDAVNEAYLKYNAEVAEIDAGEAHNQLVNSYAGNIGRFFTPVSRFAGFDWKDNISLIGGWAAKELVIGVMGTAYSMGDVKDDRQSLSTRLAADSNWSPLKAFSFMVFVMVYAPCLVTVVTIRRETASWGWAAFSTIFATTFGFILAVIIYQAGLLIL
jgi:ferrous iron transport protein B